jgi:hypothetical protein
VNVRRSRPTLLGSIAESFIGEPQAVQFGPWFCLSSSVASVWRSEFAGKPTGGFFGFYRIGKLDHTLMDVIASGTFECSNVKAGGPGGNTCQHGSCSACGTAWSEDEHDSSPWIRRESYCSQSPVNAESGRRSSGYQSRWSIKLTFQIKLTDAAERSARACAGADRSVPDSPQKPDSRAGGSKSFPLCV